MKRYGNLWDSVCDLENLRKAHYSARKGKSFYTEVKWLNQNEDKALLELRDSLVNKTFTTSPYKIEDRFDGRKVRTIYKLPYYPDRIVQHALINVCEPIWKKSFIRDTFQSIIGRGTHDARKRVESFLRGNPHLYVLKFDIEKYYPSVKNEILKAEVRRKIKCKNTLWLLDNIIDSNPGLPIGNYTSQYLGNVYLNSFDWWVKQHIKPFGYFRYCDDLIILAESKESCHKARLEIFNKLKERYGLSIKGNWQVFPLDKRRLDFVGFVFTSKNTRLRKSIAKGVSKKAKNIRFCYRNMTDHQVVNGSGSYWGWCKYGGGKSLWHKNVTSDILHKIEISKSNLKEIKHEHS